LPANPLFVELAPWVGVAQPDKDVRHLGQTFHFDLIGFWQLGHDNDLSLPQLGQTSKSGSSGSLQF